MPGRASVLASPDFIPFTRIFGLARTLTLPCAIAPRKLPNLQDIYPILAEAIRQEIDRGRTPDEIRRYIMRYSGHTGLADWCAAAARAHLAGANLQEEKL